MRGAGLGCVSRSKTGTGLPDQRGGAPAPPPSRAKRSTIWVALSSQMHKNAALLQSILKFRSHKNALHFGLKRWQFCKIRNVRLRRSRTIPLFCRYYLYRVVWGLYFVPSLPTQHPTRIEARYGPAVVVLYLASMAIGYRLPELVSFLW